MLTVLHESCQVCQHKQQQTIPSVTSQPVYILKNTRSRMTDHDCVPLTSLLGGSQACNARCCLCSHLLLVVQLHMHVRGRAVPGSPFTMDLHPGPILVDRLWVTGATTKCYAGEPNIIYIHPTDACGHATATDGSAQLTVQITSQGQHSTGTSSLHNFMPTIHLDQSRLQAHAKPPGIH